LTFTGVFRISLRKLSLLCQGRTLAIEVLSPNNTIAEIDQKIVEYFEVEYFENGSRLIWAINLKLRYVLVYRSAQEPDRLLKQSDSLDGEDVIVFFSMPLSELFQKISF
jgi:Uma2 family endonuclease